MTYLPQALGIRIAEQFGAPVLVMALCGRLFNFAVWIFLMYFAIKLIPFKKLSLLFVVFMPMMLQEAISMSADPLINGAAFLLISYVLHLRYSTKRMVDNKDRIILALLCMVTSICKITYLPICLVLFLIPKERFKHKNKWFELGIIFLGISVLTLVWLGVAMRYQLRPDDGVNSVEQIKFIMNSPIDFIEAVVRTISDKAYDFASNMVCGKLGWSDIATDSICSFVLVIMLFLVPVLDARDGNQIMKNDKICMSIIVASISLLIFLAEYLAWTPVGESMVEGVQGRYFLPLMIPLFILLNNQKIKHDFIDKFKYVFLVTIAVDFCAIVSVIGAHIG